MQHQMRAYLVRVGIDQAFGGWNAPVNSLTNEFVYVPIPESRPMDGGMITPYSLIQPALAKFESQNDTTDPRDVRLPGELATRNMHLDPDFDHLTYGDSGTRRGKGLVELGAGDFIVFYSGLKPVIACADNLIYALVGFYRVAESLRVLSVPARRWSENAHTRCVDREGSDVVVRAKAGSSGRLKKCIPIGGYREHAYRVDRGVLADWGGLSCKNGYIQRSAVLPSFLVPERFMRWFERQSPELVTANNP